MKERPILFSAPMVRAILADTKTQMRRVVKPRKDPDFGCQMAPSEIAGDKHAERLCPYGQPGDRLWVRETWAFGIHALAAARDEDGPFVYAADPMAQQQRLCDRWRPSIHMPRWASRITLEITSVRVEQLQDISIEDAKAEGVWTHESVVSDCMNHFGIDALAVNPRRAFQMLWDQINGPSSWSVNPWVWVVEFKRVEGGAA